MQKWARECKQRSSSGVASCHETSCAGRSSGSWWTCILASGEAAVVVVVGARGCPLTAGAAGGPGAGPVGAPAPHLRRRHSHGAHWQLRHAACRALLLLPCQHRCAPPRAPPACRCCPFVPCHAAAPSPPKRARAAGPRFAVAVSLCCSLACVSSAICFSGAPSSRNVDRCLCHAKRGMQRQVLTSQLPCFVQRG